ncbi:MAG: biotin carboxylase [Deltaproteobacteria bacterium]|jgi:acetyl-CoA carboxylase biotin carboxylase subunit|nr:biotin carboxylase [Deltaproteobacteria bacterium]
MFSKVAIANRGAVAARLVRTLSSLGAKSLVLCSEADQNLPYVRQADEFKVIGPPEPLKSYLNHDKVIEAAVEAKCDALHPGWGFLSENAEFAEKLRERSIVFIGPSPKWLRIMGDKVAAKKEMARLGLAVFPSTGELSGDITLMVNEASSIGFPLLIKPSGGGGGIGMIEVDGPDKLLKALESAASQALRSFNRSSLYAERLVKNPRHVEFQVVCDLYGQGFHLFERDCSIQRRRQKILEEAGAPSIDRSLLNQRANQAASVLAHLGYDQIGTVENLYEPEAGFGFLEVNPRLQVEHAVTEEICQIDLVALQVRLALGEKAGQLLKGLPEAPIGHSVEARIYAEDSLRFLPSPGPLKCFRPPSGQGIRVETGFVEGAVVTPFYDPMIAQVIASGADRNEALARLDKALADFEIEGLKTNIPFLRAMLRYPPFIEGHPNASLAAELLASDGYKDSLEKLKSAPPL